MADPEDRTLAEDYASPVEVQPGQDSANPPGWNWRRIGTSQPNSATFHVGHSDVGRVMVDVLTPTDSPPESQFRITRDIPIIIIDSLDKFWAGESRNRLPLRGLRVPVEADTKEEAKQALAADLAAQFRLLLLLLSSHQDSMAPQLKENLALLSTYLDSRPSPQ
ncbi:MAG: hypothetical protein O6920_07235 [Chloroflexi bacterium]|nr:hypothetical protein [Chloroflexota bacterium]